MAFLYHIAGVISDSYMYTYIITRTNQTAKQNYTVYPTFKTFKYATLIVYFYYWDPNTVADFLQKTQLSCLHKGSNIRSDKVNFMEDALGRIALPY